MVFFLFLTCDRLIRIARALFNRHAWDIFGLSIIRERVFRKKFVDLENMIMRAINDHETDNRRRSMTPMAANTKIPKNEGEVTPVQIKNIQEMIGRLNYIANTTRTDISYAVVLMARLMSIPSQDHLGHLDRIFTRLR